MKSVVDHIFWIVWLVDLSTYELWRRGRTSPWAARNARRVFVLVQVAMSVVRIEEERYGNAAFWVFTALVGVLLWNRPPDDDDRRRRRRKVTEKKEDTSKDWSGMDPVPAQ